MYLHVKLKTVFDIHFRVALNRLGLNTDRVNPFPLVSQLKMLLHSYHLQFHLAGAKLKTVDENFQWFLNQLIHLLFHSGGLIGEPNEEISDALSLETLWRLVVGMFRPRDVDSVGSILLTTDAATDAPTDGCS